MSSKSSSKADPSSYLHAKTLKRSLEKDLETENIEIVEINISLGSKPGDNYTSTIYRVEVKYNQGNGKDKTTSLIVKSFPVSRAQLEIEELGFIDKEVNVYNEILPRLQELVGAEILAPRCYDIFIEPHRNIVFQDMKTLGFICADREAGLDELHLKFALKKIAKFHATSMELLKRDPTIKENYQRGLFNEKTVNSALFHAIFTTTFQLGSKMLMEMPGYERFSAKLMKACDNLGEITLKAVDSNPGKDVVVFNHGDLWVNNFLFKYNGDIKPIDVVFIDYQGSFCGSLGIDLNYLFASSAQLDLLKNKMELIGKYYYPTFVETLKAFNFQPIPSIRDVIEQVKQREMYSIICLFGILPLISMDKEESKTNSLAQFANKEITEKKTLVGMSSKRFVESMKYTLVYMEETLDDALTPY